MDNYSTLPSSIGVNVPFLMLLSCEEVNTFPVCVYATLHPTPSLGLAACVMTKASFYFSAAEEKELGLSDMVRFRLYVCRRERYEC